MENISDFYINQNCLFKESLCTSSKTSNNLLRIYHPLCKKNFEFHNLEFFITKTYIFFIKKSINESLNNFELSQKLRPFIL